jgi:hypothetical protein
MNIVGWIKHNRFPLLFAATLVASEMIFVGLIWQGAPNGTRWLGDTYANSSDVAVYLSYLRQVKENGPWLKNLYAVEPSASRVDPFWSGLGFITQSGLDPRLIHEVARWILTCLLAFAVYRAAESVAKSYRDAKLGALLSILGISSGWLYTIYLYYFGTWHWKTETAADISTEFSAIIILLGGAHAILSLTLLLTSLRLSWTGIEQLNFRKLGLVAFLTGILFSFHPYFTILFLAYWTLLIVLHKKQRTLKQMIQTGGLLSLGFFPAAAIYLPLALDTVFRTHHLQDNILGFSPAISWIATLLPFGIALAWRLHKGINLKPEERWLAAWLAASIFCILLPLPWKRKLTEGWGIALVLLGLPCWLAIRDFISRQRPRFNARLLAGLLLLAAGFNSFHLLTTQLSWISAQDRLIYFYRPVGLFAAWDKINADSGPNSVVVTDDFWANTWTPAYAARTVALGHDHETPRYDEKIKSWKSNFINGDANQGLAYLNSNQITHLILTLPDMRDRLAEPLQNTGWIKTLSNVSVDLWTAPGI